MIYIVLILVVILIFLVVILTFYSKEKKAKDETINELKEENAALKAQKEKEHEIDQQTVEQVASITTGDNQHDFNAGIDLLHELSGKRKTTK